MVYPAPQRIKHGFVSLIIQCHCVVFLFRFVILVCVALGMMTEIIEDAPVWRHSHVIMLLANLFLRAWWGKGVELMHAWIFLGLTYVLNWSYSHVDWSKLA